MAEMAVAAGVVMATARMIGMVVAAASALAVAAASATDGPQAAYAVGLDGKSACFIRSRMIIKGKR